MDRKEFLSLITLTATSVAFPCLSGCSKSNTSSSPAAPTNVDFTIDLNTNTQLNTNGGYIYSNGIIVARTLTGQFIAVQQVCTHENFTLVYQGSGHRFYCDGHGGTFNESGQVTGGPPPAALTKYNTSLNGNLLRVYS
jgi:cytochrome b6-f complex iron-sulfur subunit